mmetsp:Transcript_48252/g.49093  ORF Transcript_48252/g.49093 Transcript_48252/m.49093 type:complete len:85 (-) Transcript_48252:239-493(-)
MWHQVPGVTMLVWWRRHTHFFDPVWHWKGTPNEEDPTVASRAPLSRRDSDIPIYTTTNKHIITILCNSNYTVQVISFPFVTVIH